MKVAQYWTKPTETNSSYELDKLSTLYSLLKDFPFPLFNVQLKALRCKASRYTVKTTLQTNLLERARRSYQNKWYYSKFVFKNSTELSQQFCSKKKYLLLLKSTKETDMVIKKQ